MNVRPLYALSLAIALAIPAVGADAVAPTPVEKKADPAAPAAKSAGVPANLVAEGLSEIPDALKQQVSHYLKLGGAEFRGWHGTRREMLVCTRAGNALQLHSVARPMADRIRMTMGAEPVQQGAYQPGDGNLLVYSTDTGGNENYQLYVFDTSLKRALPVLLTDGKSRNTGPHWSHDGKQLAYASTRRNGKDNDIYAVDPADPQSNRLVAESTSPYWTVEDWSDDDSHILLNHQINEKKHQLSILDVKSGAKQLVTPPDEEQIYEHARFGDHDTAIYAATNHDSDFMRLTRIELVSGKHEALSGSIPWDVELFDLSADGKTVAFVTDEDGFGRLHLLDLATRKELAVPKLPGDVIADLAWHPKLREIGFTLNGSTTPNDAYSLDADTGVLTRWTDRPKSARGRDHFAEPELVRVKSFDGLSISSLVYRPDKEKFPGKRPVVIIIHGGPSSQARPGFRGSANFYLNDLGMTLVYPNVRGSLGYGRKFLDMDNGLLREDPVKDIGAVIDWIRADPSLDTGRIAVMGGSYGGFMSLACMVKYNTILRCGVDMVGIANFASFLNNTSDYRRDNRREEYGDERDPAVLKFLDSISPAKQPDQFKAPLFIIQGKNDPRVPLSEAERMRDAIRGNGGKVWYLMATDEGHGFKKTANIDFQMRAIITFFREFLLK